MDSESSSAFEGWDEQVTARLPELREGQFNARISHDRIIGIVVLEQRKHHVESTKVELELIATVATLDYEVKTLLLRLIEDPADRAIWHKYLALVLWQVLDELPARLGPELRLEAKSFKDALKGIKKDRAFMAELKRIRNAVAAHLDFTDDGPGRLEWSHESIMSKRRGEPAILTDLGLRAMDVSTAVHKLGSALIRRNIALFPDAKV